MLTSFLRSKRLARSLYVSLNEQTAFALNTLPVAQLTTDQRLEKAGDSGEKERTFYLTNFIRDFNGNSKRSLFHVHTDILLKINVT